MPRVGVGGMMTRTTGRAGQHQAIDGTDGWVNLGSSSGGTARPGRYFLNMPQCPAS
jgi:hypothetical protein